MSFATGSTISKTTGKARRKPKQRAKKVSAREGSPHEEEYLANALRELLPAAAAFASIQEELKALLYFGHLRLATALQTAFRLFLGTSRS
jgi:hypothetical protein